jgi:ethanolamine utilization protein EutN
VQLLDRENVEDCSVIVAVDLIGAGIGEKVLVTQGSSARRSSGLAEAPIDSIIVGIIDVKDEE